eukprot:SAG11_NODE_971_length_6351_cov_4.531190_3_plen_142_part_00
MKRLCCALEMGQLTPTSPPVIQHTDLEGMGILTSFDTCNHLRSSVVYRAEHSPKRCAAFGTCESKLTALMQLSSVLTQNLIWSKASVLYSAYFAFLLAVHGASAASVPLSLQYDEAYSKVESPFVLRTTVHAPAGGGAGCA